MKIIILIIIVGFCKKTGINNIMNQIITPFVSYQMRWLNANGIGLSTRTSMWSIMYVDCILYIKIFLLIMYNPN
jgi:hypothetical protein